MDTRSIDKVKHRLNTDVVRRLLIRYFAECKGFAESFDRLLYPAMVQDMAQQIPQLQPYVEVEPYAVEVDPIGGRAILGWNLYVLGTHRCFLGETYHRDLLDLARQIMSGTIMIPEGGLNTSTNIGSAGGTGGTGSPTARRQVTPRIVVNFVTRVLSKHEHGYVDLSAPRNMNVGSPMSPGFGNTMNGQFFAKPGL